jgi:plastocyanin
MMRPSRGIVALLGGAALAAGGLSVAGAAAPRADHAQVRVQVRETEYHLAFRALRARVSQRVTFTALNRGAITHALAISGPGLSASSTPNIGPGQRAPLAVRFRKPGRYTLWCPVDGHRGLGMVATITVRK